MAPGLLDCLAIPGAEFFIIYRVAAMFYWLLKSSKLEDRAEAAAKQMRYFRLFSQRGSFDELGASARRAGFIATHEGAFEAKFQWAADGDHPDFTFHVSLDDHEKMSANAKSCPGDIFGLVMTSLETKISIEKDNSLEEHELGRHAYRFRSLLLTLQDFDDGIEEFVRCARLDQPFAATSFQ